MQQAQGHPEVRNRRGEDDRRQNVSAEQNFFGTDRRLSGEPAKYNTRMEHRRIVWENDLYERQSI